MFDHYNKIPLAVNITVQKLYINDALGVLGWVKPLFEYIYNDYILLCEHNKLIPLVLYTATIAFVSANMNSDLILNETIF